MRFKGISRKTVNISQAGLIETQLIQPNQRLPLVVKPAVSDISLINWTATNKTFIETMLLQHGGILFRGFKLQLASEFEALIRALSGKLTEYSYRSTPRSKVSGNVYTSTEYPADQLIPLHNEMAYASSWPMKILFFCSEAAQHGGETPIADSRKVFQRVNPDVRERFRHKKIMYVRNYGEGLDLHWKTVFQTNEKSEVETYCHQAEIEFEWRGADHLRTRQVCQAVATHPKTGETVWFNQAHLFHVSSLKTEVRDFLLSVLKEPDLPRNAYYGDGSRIEDSILDEIREIYHQETIMFRWQKGDILLLDNMLTAHGRMPFLGARKVVVGMAEPYSETVQNR
ncbi:TauD/TfdA family dioxygenase [Leptothoe sp. EHU-05/26/07-4]